MQSVEVKSNNLHNEISDIGKDIAEILKQS